ncbi:acetyl-CoA carboxylase, carboxyltransferase subunit beta [Parvularcula lutaonensis]|uniref:Acetyl-coenzyme A carboxylase carboxyl transferase subunit beta n=1 Tax=Parvularcula lutaonensis TaxID=491923 RepID=A0ABV7M9F3_9PROT|nr:acetyl-CoA carboxylase, carboxyltransferase subunit beta [Parvularcula lutaonensis]GGY47069.1 acetyl-coenzyme A carboxylase carboxyl transferase subunit beta [Parvularcula lutaonensis]
MNWLSDITPPGIKKMFKQDDNQEALWTRCPSCEQMTFNRDLEHEQMVCPNCGHHHQITPVMRLFHLLGEDWERIELPETPDDPLKFKDTKPYSARLKDYRKRTGERDALVVGKGKIGDRGAVVAVQNFKFMGGSMGTAIGEGLLTAADEAVKSRSALIVVTASGGARMQEGILSLMQMPRSTIAVQKVREAGLPYIVILTNPTTGGVTASYAMLGDIHIAEPGALIGFAGPRVIEQTIREKLPEDFQRAEYLLDKGMIDRVTDRRELARELSEILSVLMPPPEIEVPVAANDEASTVAGEDGPLDDTLPKAAE